MCARAREATARHKQPKGPATAHGLPRPIRSPFCMSPAETTSSPSIARSWPSSTPRASACARRSGASRPPDAGGAGFRGLHARVAQHPPWRRCLCRRALLRRWRRRLHCAWGRSGMLSSAGMELDCLNLPGRQRLHSTRWCLRWGPESDAQQHSRGWRGPCAGPTLRLGPPGTGSICAGGRSAQQRRHCWSDKKNVPSGLSACGGAAPPAQGARSRVLSSAGMEGVAGPTKHPQRSLGCGFGPSASHLLLAAGASTGNENQGFVVWLLSLWAQCLQSDMKGLSHHCKWQE